MTSSVDNPTDKKRLLIVDDDIDVSDMLRAFFDVQGYEVSIARRGEDAIPMVRDKHPHAILLDIVLPGMDGYEVCREIRQKTETSHIPIIFLTIKDERSDKIAGLELGADDYITKPFEIDELSLRIRNAIDRAEREILDEGESLLPGKRLIKEKLQDSTKPWTFIDLKIKGFDDFVEAYGRLASGEVLKLHVKQLIEIIDEFGTPDDLVGKIDDKHFIVITYSDKAAQLEEAIVNRFNNDAILHYSFIDQERKYIVLPNGEKHPLMTMSTKSSHQLPIEGIDLT